MKDAQDLQKVHRCLLLHEKYAKAIVGGKKIWELRRNKVIIRKDKKTGYDHEKIGILITSSPSAFVFFIFIFSSCFLLTVSSP